MPYPSKPAFRPPTPDIFGKWNFIVGWFMQGCEADITLYVQYAREPAWDTFAVLVGLDLQDTVKEFFRPRGLRDARHGRKGRRKGKGVPNIPDVSETVAKKLPGHGMWAGRQFGSPTFYAYHITDVSDRVVWNLALIEMSTDLAYESMMGMVRFETDVCPQMGRFGIKMDYDYLFRSPVLSSTTMNDIYMNPRIYPWTISGVQLPTPHRWLCIFEVTFFNPFPGEVECQVGLYSVQDMEVFAESYTATISTGENVTLSCSASISDPLGVQWMTKQTQSCEARYKKFECYSVS